MEATTQQRIERTNIWSLTSQENYDARAWWATATQAEKEAFGLYFRTRAGYRWGAMEGTETARIALTLINAGVICNPQCPCCDHQFSANERRFAGLCCFCAAEKFGGAQ